MQDSGNEIAMPSGTDFSQWHTYGLLWTPGNPSTSTPGQAKWYFDNQLVRTASLPVSADTGPAPYLVLNEQVSLSGDWNTGGPPLVPALHNYVDYLRVWQAP